MDPFERISFESSITNDVVDETFLDRTLREGYKHSHQETWITTAEDVVTTLAESHTLLASIDGTQDACVFNWDGVPVLVKIVNYAGNLTATFASSELTAWKDVYAKLKETFPPADPDKEHKVGVSFWSQGPNGASNYRRDITVPNWEDVTENYSADVGDVINDMVGDEFVPGEGGQLLLWHGVPGAGKTWAIRALCWEWRKWCSAHYITDPETFFGNAGYMLQVMLGADQYDPYEDGTPKSSKWKLLIIEDAGELLTADARERTGQGLSRLLNTVDGMIGQGMKVMILITTNEPLKKLHEAVGRDGRCAVELEFDRFNSQEIEDWLDNHDLNVVEPPKHATLAELYSLKKGNSKKMKKQRQPAGFMS